MRMITLIKNQTIRLLCFGMFGILLLSSCEEKEFNQINPQRQEPSIVVSGEENTVNAYTGQTINAVVSLDAQAGISSIRILQDGEELEVIEGASGQVGHEYNIRYVVNEDLQPGDQVVYKFILEDQTGRTIEQNFTILIVEAPPVPEFEFEDINIGGNDYKLINLDINRDVTLSSDYDYLLRGKIAIIEGATLQIDPGTHIYAEPASSLILATGSKIIAEGTASEPIRFTSLREQSNNPQAGDWVGLFLQGLAPVPGGEDLTLIGTSGLGRGYGGTDDADDSGQLKFVEIAYAGGYLVGSDAGISGALNLNGVGSSTVLENIFINESGSRQAIFVHGGSARMKYILVHNPRGRAFRWVDGYTGFVQFFAANYTTVEGFNDGYTAFDGYDAAGASPTPIFSNVAVQGGGFTGTPGSRGVRLRANGKGAFYNGWYTNSGTGLRTESSATLVFAHNRVWDNNSAYHSSASAYNSTGAPYYNSSSPISITAGFKGIASEGALDPSTLDPWFTPAAYIGAVDPGDDWSTVWELP